MTIIDERPRTERPKTERPRTERPSTTRQPQPPLVSREIQPRVRRSPVRPAGARPAIAPLPYRGHRIALSTAVHRRRTVSTSVTIGLAGLAALITLWLGCVAQFSGDRSAAPTEFSERLAVVQVRSGETLQHLAARVAPGASASAVVERIMTLNQLDSAALDAGQTLIAPVG